MKAEKHQTCISILEAIDTFKNLKKLAIESRSNLISMVLLPELVKKYSHKIDIYNRCISRLWKKYWKVVGELNTRDLSMMTRSELQELQEDSDTDTYEEIESYLNYMYP